MKTTLILSISTAVILYGCGVRIYFSPFKIEYPNWKQLFGWILTGIGILLLVLHGYFKGYEKGLRKGGDLVIEVLKETQVNQENY